MTEELCSLAASYLQFRMVYLNSIRQYVIKILLNYSQDLPAKLMSHWLGSAMIHVMLGLGHLTKPYSGGATFAGRDGSTRVLG